VATLARYAWLLVVAIRDRDAERSTGRRRAMTDPFTLSVVSIVALALLGLPIGHAMIASSILYLMLAGLDMGTAAEQLLNGLFSSYILLAVPLFILAAELMNSGSMTIRLLAFCNAFVGRFRGGLALVNVVQSIIFAGMSGSAIADAAGTGRMMQRMMTEGGKYPPQFAAALTASSAVIGPIIPPSIPVVVYALVSDASIGYLFLAGVIPGLLMGLFMAVLIVLTARRRNFPVEEPVPVRELPGVTFRALPALMMPVVLLGGIYGGATTPTEAAAVAALYALLVSALLYRSITWSSLYDSLATSARTTPPSGC
jgi:C4-dicarboxylate transporter, DctM subunit